MERSKIVRRAARAGGWGLAKRVLKPIPVVGTAVVLGTAGLVLRRKGALLGTADVGLDMIPILGTAKAVIEFFTGDLIPDRRK